jgi:hypothetical protein
MQTSLPQVFFSPLIRQEFRTENEQGEDYEYEDSENKDDGEEEGSDTLSTSSTPTTLPQDILRKPIPNFAPPEGRNTSYLDYPNEPYRDICPEAAMNKSIPWFMQENDTRIVVCVANFPYLPYYGALHYYHGSSYVSTPKVTNLSFPHIPAWMDILPLGVYHWRFLIILTELLPQPFPPTDPSFAAQIPINYETDYTSRKKLNVILNRNWYYKTTIIVSWDFLHW